MDLRQITPTYSVTPQIEPSDIATLAAMGVKTLICNRPDMENPPALQAAVMQAEAEAHGIDFIYNPFQGHTMSQDHVDEQADALADAEGPVVGYCASGNRCTVVWAFGVAGHVPVDEIIAIGTSHGYPFEQLRPALEAAAARNTQG
ncbi:TIGR01244 family phosphatase [Rhodobacteraceae bacterium N5(2021)]|uniref:TIGR01244 family phosphatase n=1 Tax=Gymnodinialimonas phycosphaerae TaxID=2841589 RepID=A0A975TXR0_9RHOB|nr:TIGR01244 family sulfur transferase [Gymnodinialimonas phycosphaerae]MBY4892483.1 TIGR01244 family phosphatase [Gymnodinialimonas phycosphaerae]